MNLLVAGIVVYVVAQLAIGILASRRVRNEEDYLLAGRGIGVGMATLSLFATWFGAESCIGAAGATYTEGLRGGRADPFGYAGCLVLMGLVFAVPLRRGGFVTFADVFRSRYGPSVEKLVVLMLVPASILWGAAQIRALGHVLSVTTQMDLGGTITIAALVVVVYTMFGGMRADVTNDFVQSIVLILGLGLLLAMVVHYVGGLEVAWERMVAAAGGSAAGAPRGAHDAVAHEPPLEAVEAWVIPVLGSISAPEMAGRVLASRSPAQARKAALLAGTLYLIVGLVPLSLGLIGAGLMPGLADPEQIIPLLASTHLGTLAQVAVFGALVAAILSTVDSNLLSASALVSHNIVLRRWTSATERQRLLVARGGVLVGGLIAYLLAFSQTSVYELVEASSAFGGGGLAVVMAFGLLTRFGGLWSALAALISGAFVQTFGTYVAGWPHPMTTSAVVALTAFAGVALVERRRRKD